MRYVEVDGARLQPKGIVERQECRVPDMLLSGERMA